MIVSLVGSAILPAPIGQWVEANRGMAFGAAFLFNMIGSSMLQTGAFEVYVGDKRIWSKLQVGSVPNINQIIKLIRESQ